MFRPSSFLKQSFYVFWEYAGIAASILTLILFVIALGSAWLAIPAWLVIMVCIEFGCFASRDREHDRASLALRKEAAYLREAHDARLDKFLRMRRLLSRRVVPMEDLDNDRVSVPRWAVACVCEALEESPDEQITQDFGGQKVVDAFRSAVTADR